MQLIVLHSNRDWLELQRGMNCLIVIETALVDKNSTKLNCKFNVL